jgi:hypothetical protein
MDGLDGLMLRQGVGRPAGMRATLHGERRLAGFQSLPRSMELCGAGCEGWQGAA